MIYFINTWKLAPHLDALSGRPSHVTPRIERRVRYMALRDRCMPFWEVGKLMEPSISESTVRRILAAVGYHRRKARTVFYLTAVHRAAQLKWAQKHAEWSDFEWLRIIWSDEAYIVAGDSVGKFL